MWRQSWLRPSEEEGRAPPLLLLGIKSLATLLFLLALPAATAASSVVPPQVRPISGDAPGWCEQPIAQPGRDDPGFFAGSRSVALACSSTSLAAMMLLPRHSTLPVGCSGQVITAAADAAPGFVPLMPTSNPKAPGLYVRNSGASSSSWKTISSPRRVCDFDSVKLASAPRSFQTAADDSALYLAGNLKESVTTSFGSVTGWRPTQLLAYQCIGIQSSLSCSSWRRIWNATTSASMPWSASLLPTDLDPVVIDVVAGASQSAGLFMLTWLPKDGAVRVLRFVNDTWSTFGSPLAFTLSSLQAPLTQRLNIAIDSSNGLVIVLDSQQWLGGSSARGSVYEAPISGASSGVWNLVAPPAGSNYPTQRCFASVAYSEVYGGVVLSPALGCLKTRAVPSLLETGSLKASRVLDMHVWTTGSSRSGWRQINDKRASPMMAGYPSLASCDSQLLLLGDLPREPDDDDNEDPISAVFSEPTDVDNQVGPRRSGKVLVVTSRDRCDLTGATFDSSLFRIGGSVSAAFGAFCVVCAVVSLAIFLKRSVHSFDEGNFDNVEAAAESRNEKSLDLDGHDSSGAAASSAAASAAIESSPRLAFNASAGPERRLRELLVRSVAETSKQRVKTELRSIGLEWFSSTHIYGLFVAVSLLVAYCLVFAVGSTADSSSDSGFWINAWALMFDIEQKWKVPIMWLLILSITLLMPLLLHHIVISRLVKPNVHNQLAVPDSNLGLLLSAVSEADRDYASSGDFKSSERRLRGPMYVLCLVTSLVSGLIAKLIFHFSIKPALDVGSFGSVLVEASFLFGALLVGKRVGYKGAAFLYPVDTISYYQELLFVESLRSVVITGVFYLVTIIQLQDQGDLSKYLAEVRGLQNTVLLVFISKYVHIEVSLWIGASLSKLSDVIELKPTMNRAVSRDTESSHAMASLPPGASSAAAVDRPPPSQNEFDADEPVRSKATAGKIVSKIKHPRHMQPVYQFRGFIWVSNYAMLFGVLVPVLLLAGGVCALLSLLSSRLRLAKFPPLRRVHPLLTIGAVRTPIASVLLSLFIFGWSGWSIGVFQLTIADYDEYTDSTFYQLFIAAAAGFVYLVIVGLYTKIFRPLVHKQMTPYFEHAASFQRIWEASRFHGRGICSGLSGAKQPLDTMVMRSPSGRLPSPENNRFGTISPPASPQQLQGRFGAGSNPAGSMSPVSHVRAVEMAPVAPVPMSPHASSSPAATRDVLLLCPRCQNHIRIRVGPAPGCMPGTQVACPSCFLAVIVPH